MGEVPWIEKYRPKTMKDIVLSEHNRTILNNMITNDYYPNFILYGPPGTGKTTTILCLMNDYCQMNRCSSNYIHLNASHERGIEVIRNQIFNFTEKKNFFNDARKFVLLDEIDSMTKQAQNNLDIVINKCKNKVTFILICNYFNRIIEPLRKKFIVLHFKKTSYFCDTFLQNCIKNENVKICEQKIKLIKEANLHDIRSILNQIQNYDNKDVFLDESIFRNLLDTTKNYSLMVKICKKTDPHNVLLFFFNKLYEHYSLDKDLVYTMKLLLTVHCDIDYFVKKFIPSLIKKLNLSST